MDLEGAIKNLKDSFYAQEDTKIAELTKAVLEAGADPQDLLENHLLKWTKDITGRSIYDIAREVDIEKQKMAPEKEVMLSELVIVAECLTNAVAVLKPEFAKTMTKVNAPGRVVIGTVEGDIHDIGKTLVGDILAAAGYEVIDVGYDVPAKEFVTQTKNKKADILALSCSMGMARLVLGETVKELKKQGLRDNVKVITGGQASSEADVKMFEIDAFGSSISAAMTQCNELMRMLKEQRKRA
jgi:methylmalonyl-CoA mutase cobalamin-binding domain/chain